MPTTIDTLWAMWSSTMAALGTVVAVGGGAAAIAFLLFRFLGEKWINAKFEQRLAAYKHAQQEELERLKFKINALMDRTTKLHQREFDVIPEAWAALFNADVAVRSFASPFQEYPDVGRMTEARLEEFLKSTPLTDWQKDELRAARDKHKNYVDAIYWHNAAQAKNTYREFSTYFKKNGIFIPEPLKSKFAEISDMLWDAIVEHEANTEYDIRPRERGKWKALTEKGPELMKAIEADVQSRLWSSHVTEV
jgi:hypothetical protein